MIRRFVDRMSRINQGYGDFMERRTQLQTAVDVFFWCCVFGLFWAFAWNAHIIGPWVDNLMGWGPHDIDSERKVQWRRMWSTAICLPGMIFSVLLYLRNRKNRHK